MVQVTENAISRSVVNGECIPLSTGAGVGVPLTGNLCCMVSQVTELHCGLSHVHVQWLSVWLGLPAGQG